MRSAIGATSTGRDRIDLDLYQPWRPTRSARLQPTIPSIGLPVGFNRRASCIVFVIQCHKITPMGREPARSCPSKALPIRPA
jgi:hypothetical protein